MAIQVRRGNYEQFDPTRMRDGEFAVCLDNGYVYMTLSPGNVIQLGTITAIQEALTQAQAYANAADISADSATNSKKDAEAWAVGKRNGSDVPSSDPTYHNNAKYWAQQANQTVSISEREGTATVLGGQILTVNGVPNMVVGTAYLQDTKVMSTSGSNVFTFTNDALTDDCGIDVWTSVYGLNPTNVEVGYGQCEVTFGAQRESISVTCRIYVV